MKTVLTAYSFGCAIVDILKEAGYSVNTVNNKVTRDSVVEHVMDIDILGKDYLFNMSININRICTRDQYVQGDEANPPHPELAK